MKYIIQFAILFLVVSLLFACKKETSITPAISGNKPPVVNAGADQTISLPIDSVHLTGSGTDPDGSIASFHWKKTAGPSLFVIVNPNDAVTKVKGLTAGVYQFELTGTDNAGASSKDTVVITVVAPSGTAIQDYRSKRSGTWKDVSSWERFDGTRWVDALRSPYNIDGQITILNGHNITVSSPVEIDQVIINNGGGLIIKSDLSLSDQFATTDNDYELINNGTLEWQDGQIGFLGGYSVVTLVNNGNFIISGNNTTWSPWWDSEARFINTGTITKTSSGFTSLEYIHYMTNTSTGIIQGVGTISVNGDISWLPNGFTNNGTIAPGLPIGILKINSVFRPFSSNSILSIEVKDNSGPGSGHDQLLFDKNVTLSGTLTVTETGTAVSNGKFNILTTTGKVEGNFNKTILPAGYSLQINSSSVELIKQ